MIYLFKWTDSPTNIFYFCVMEIQGKVKSILPAQTGQGKNGTWKKQDFILETEGKFPKSVCITVWGDKMEQFGIAAEQEVIASIDIESREFNGKWYTNVQAWKVVQAQAGGAAEGGMDQSTPFPAEEPSFASSSDGEDDLPF